MIEGREGLSIQRVDVAYHTSPLKVSVIIINIIQLLA